MSIQPITGIRIQAKDWPRGIRIKDIADHMRARGYQLVMQRFDLLAVKVH